MNRKKIIAGLIAATLTACASNVPKDYAQERLSLADQAIPATWLLGVPGQGTDPLSWGQIYDDPILLNYLRQAKTANFDIRQARLRVTQAEANLRRAKSQLIPRIDLSGSAGGSAFLGDFDSASDSYSLGLGGRWDPDIFGQTRLSIDQSDASLTAQTALTADTIQAILAATAIAYVRAVESDMQVALAKTNLDFLTESRRISEARYRLGDTAKGDFSFAEANYQNALASYENTLQAARQTKRALSILLGDFPVNDLQLADTLKDPRALPARLLPAQILERRPDIIAARAQVAERYANLRGTERAYWPSIGISGGLSAGSSISDLFDPADYIANLSASLAQVIFDGGAIDASIDNAKADLNQTILTYESRLRSAMGEITNAYDRLDTLRRTLANLQAASLAANEALRLESIQYDLGESSLLDVLQVQTRVNGIDASLIRTRADVIETLIAANDATSGFLVE